MFSALLAAVVLLAASTTASAQDDAFSKSLAQARNEMQKCGLLALDPKLDAIRTVFPLDGWASLTDAMLSSNLRASTVQAAALRWHESNVLACQDRVARQYMPEIANSTEQALRQRVAGLHLALLIDRKITFGDYAAVYRLAQVQAQSSIEKMTRMQAEISRLQGTKSGAGLLLCTIDDPVVGQFEITVSYDESSNSAIPSRGAAVTKSLVTPSEIVIQQGATRTTISRLTGRMSMTFDQGTTNFAGMCSSAPKPRF